jgi:hypothetical protein
MLLVYSAENIRGGIKYKCVYHAKIISDSDEALIRQLMIDTDRIAAIQNTLRVATPVILQSIEVGSE